jgi:hypothetical protein
MRSLALALLFAASPAIAAGPASPLKAFEFRGIVAGEPLTREQLAKCEPLMPGTLSCDHDDRKVAGIDVMSVGIFVTNNRLSSVSIMSDPIFFSVLTSAFKTKYGPPCRSALPRWVGELGNSRPNPTMTWCFRSGKLVAKMYGARLDVSEIDYTENTQAALPSAKPKVDF